MGRGEKRLFHAIRQAVDSGYSPKAVFVYNTCRRADRRRYRRRMQGCGGKMRCAGGTGGLRRFLRHQEPGQPHRGRIMFKHVVGTAEPLPVPAAAQRPGITVHDVTYRRVQHRGGAGTCAPLFDELGLRILCTLSGCRPAGPPS